MTELTAWAGDMVENVGTAGALVVGAGGAALVFGFVVAWMSKVRRAASKG